MSPTGPSSGFEVAQVFGHYGGGGPSAPTLKDNRELAIAATDLTQPQRFKNGDRPEDVYRTLMTYLAELGPS